MKKFASILFLGVLLVTAAYATGPVQEVSTLTSVGFTDPIVSPWGVDIVAWATVGTAPTVFGRSGGGRLGNFVYEFGSEGLNTAQAFNLTTNLWVASTPATNGYDNWASATTGSAIYLIGGYNGSTALNFCQRFTPTTGGPTGTWTQMAVYPLAVYGPTASWDGGDYIYVASGNLMSGYSLTAYRYSISGNAWTMLAAPPVSQSFSGSAYVGGKFYVFGGTDAAGLGTRNYAYNPATNTWAVAASAPLAVWFATSSTTSNGTVLMSVGGGGGYGSWPATAAVQLFDPLVDSWTSETALPVARGCNQATWLGAGEVLSGGGYAAGYSGVTYRGSGFFSAASMVLDLTPTGSTTISASTGGSIPYTANLTNNESVPVSFQYWNKITQGATVVIVFGPISRISPAGPGYVINRALTQVVAGGLGLVPGPATYSGYVGSSPTVWTSDSFPITVTADFQGGPFSENQLTGWEEETAVLNSSTPANFELKGNYPNPFNPTTTISYSLGNDNFVNLAVFDLSGREVANLVNGYRTAGNHSVTFDATGLTSGVYVYRLTSGASTVTAKMVLMK